MNTGTSDYLICGTIYLQNVEKSLGYQQYFSILSVWRTKNFTTSKIILKLEIIVIKTLLGYKAFRDLKLVSIGKEIS